MLFLFVVDLWRDAPRLSLYFDLTWLMLWSTDVKLNKLEDNLTPLKRKPYGAPSLSRLQWTELTREQQAWTQNERARHSTDDPKRL